MSGSTKRWRKRQVCVRLTEEEYEVLQRKGGARWLRSLILKIPNPKVAWNLEVDDWREIWSKHWDLPSQ